MGHRLWMVVLLLAGCGRGDPAQFRFEPGEGAILYSKAGSAVFVGGKASLASAPPGTRVTIVSDEQEGFTRDGSDRKVRVNIPAGNVEALGGASVEGAYLGEVSREDLRPAD